MGTMHRYDSEDRQHYLFQQRYSIKLKPRLLYVGELKKREGWQENPHQHEFCEIIFITDGSGTVTANGIVHPVTKGDLVIYNPDLIHAEENSADAPMQVLFLALNSLKITDLPENYLLPPGLDIVFHSGRFYDTFLSLFNRMISEFEHKDIFYAEISQNLALTFVMYVFRIINEQEKDSTPLLQNNANISEALTYIHNNLHQELTLESIAKHCHLNKYYLSHLFSQYQGISLGKYVLQLRMKEAMHLLRETTLSVNDVADRVGFNDISYFCRTFKKETTLTPLQYRKKL